MAPGPTGGRKLKRIDAKEVNPGMVSEMGCRFGLTAMEVWTQLGRSLEVASLMLFAFCPGFPPWTAQANSWRGALDLWAELRRTLYARPPRSPCAVARTRRDLESLGFDIMA